MDLANYVGGRWELGTLGREALIDPTLGTELVHVSSAGIDYAAAVRYAREVAGPQLRQLTYGGRANLLSRVADVLAAHRERYYQIGLENSGSPKSDAMIDIEGAIFTLRFYAKEAAALGEHTYLRDGALTRLGKDESFQALHLAVPVEGVAVLINAFNFPAWGLWEKAAPALLSGVPVLLKPATATAWLAHQMIEDVVQAGVVPDGALSIVCGRAGNLLEAVTGTDLIAFTGSSATAARIRSETAHTGARINIEADSLNVALLGPDVSSAAPEFELFAAEIVREMTVKAGQKCTAIRRVLVPAAHRDLLLESLRSRLGAIAVGDPRRPEVQMGPLVSKAQQRSVLDGIAHLAAECSIVFGGDPGFQPSGIDEPSRAAFVQPTLLTHQEPLNARAVHELEIFGPVVTVLPYHDLEQAFQIARLGQGSLVASVFTADPAVAAAAAVGLGSSHGRVHIVSSEVGRSQTGHGNVMPMSVHGGPGKAGGGQELGGLRALRFYHQLCAVQGPSRWLSALSDQAACAAS